ncbi:hypothetical protein D3C72_2537950 [compost metagenome]
MISRFSPKPAELMMRIRLNASPASFFSTSSISSVLACLRTWLMSSMMLACEGVSSLVSTSEGRANQ